MARGVVSAADGTKKMRAVQVRLLADEVRDDLEHVEPYGFTSEPKDDELPEAFALFFGGDRSHGIVFCVADRRYRLKNLKPGEVALYDDLGQKVHFTREGIVVETPGALTATVAKDASVAVGGNLTAEVAGCRAESVFCEAGYACHDLDGNFDRPGLDHRQRRHGDQRRLRREGHRRSDDDW